MKTRILSILLAVITVFSGLFICANAANISDIKTELPEITAIVNVPAGTKFDSSKVKATLNDVPLKVEKAEKSEESTEWIVLIDTSISSKAYFDAEKASIVTILNSLGDNDKLVLYYFKENAVKVLDGTETKEDATKKINALKCDGQDTVFYDAVSKLIDEANKSESDVVVSIIFSDGVDTISKTTKEQITKKVKESDVQIYGYYADKLDKKTADEFNSFLKISGGKAESFTPDNAVDKLKARSSEETIELKLKATEPVEESDKAVLSIDLGDGKAITKEIKTSAWAPVETTEAESETETSAESQEETSKTEKQETTTEQNNDDKSGLPLPIIIVAAVVVLAIVAFLILKKKKNSPEPQDEKNEPKPEENLHITDTEIIDSNDSNDNNADVDDNPEEPETVKMTAEEKKALKAEKAEKKKAEKLKSEEEAKKAELEKRVKKLEEAERKQKEQMKAEANQKMAAEEKKAKKAEEAERKKAEAAKKKEEERKAKERQQFQFYFEDKNNKKK